jgi:hypothetical protein
MDSDYLRASFLVPRLVVRVAEDVIHDGDPASDRRPDDVPVDGLSDVGRLVADRVTDVLDRDAVAAHDRDCGVAALMGVRHGACVHTPPQGASCPHPPSR